MEDNNKFFMVILIMLLGIVVIMGGCLLQLDSIKCILQTQFEYQAEADLCFEEAWHYESSCHVERGDDDSYNWYWK